MGFYCILGVGKDRATNGLQHQIWAAFCLYFGLNASHEFCIGESPLRTSISIGDRPMN